MNADDPVVGKSWEARGQRAPEPEKTSEAWRRYVETGRIEPDLLRERTYLAWTRCKTLGASPHVVTDKRLSHDETVALLRRHDALIEAARPYLRALSHAAGERGHAAVLSDAEGTVLEVVGDLETMAAQEVGFPAPGVSLSEAVAGCNGIGTSLADDDYVEIIGPEHFVGELRSYTCQGVPLRSPPERVGAAAIVVRGDNPGDRLREILFCAAKGIEADLMRRRVEGLEEKVISTFGHQRAAASPKVDELRHDLVQLQAAARLRMETAAHVTARAEDAQVLVLAADALVHRFERQSKLWLDIADEGTGAPEPVDLAARIAEMCELFETEATVRGIHLVRDESAPTWVNVDPHTVPRLLFHAFLTAFSKAPAGADVSIGLDRPLGGEVKVAFSTGHQLTMPAAPPAPYEARATESSKESSRNQTEARATESSKESSRNQTEGR